MRQDELSPAPGSRKNRKRVGRGDGSGHGSFSGRGCKGQKSRSGFTRRPAFDVGGVMPALLRLPMKRGFTNIFRVEFELVNLGELDACFPAGTEVTPETMFAAGLTDSPERPVKVLSDGNLTHALTIKAAKFSAAAKAKIEAAGGKAEEI
jgi:large subunit ribosomal protein L15